MIFISWIYSTIIPANEQCYKLLYLLCQRNDKISQDMLQRHSYTTRLSIFSSYLLWRYNIKFLKQDIQQVVFNNDLSYLLDIETEDRQKNRCYKSTGFQKQWR